MTMQNRCLKSLTVGALAVALTIVSRAEAPQVYAIRGARIVTAVGAPIASGTLVIRNGLIEAVGASIQPPAEAIVIDGNGLTVYPGLIDMGSTIAVDTPTNQGEPQNLRTTEESERWRRGLIFRPEHNAADQLRADSPELSRLASHGITSVLALPSGSVVKGRSALVNVAGPEDDPQIGSVGDYRRGLQVVKTPVALHIEFASGGRGGAYPVSLMGVIAFVRQSFLDAQHQRLAEQRYERLKTGAPRPAYDPSLAALQPALEGRVPVAFEADAAREILRALRMAEEFKLDPVITGGREADHVAADLKSRNARVIYGLDFPTRSRTLAPDADEPVRTLRTRAQAPKVPAALAKAGILFAFSSAGLRDSRDFVRNAARVVKEGLPQDAALRALTIDAAKIAGAADRLGSLEKGKIANVVVVEGDLFDEKMRVKHVFVDGRSIAIDDAQPQPRGRGGV
jgi:imidazolonepropionase-like amidohydrolase